MEDRNRAFGDGIPKSMAFQSSAWTIAARPVNARRAPVFSGQPRSLMDLVRKVLNDTGDRSSSSIHE